MELIVALMLLGLGAGAIGGSILVAIRNTTRGIQRQDALILAREYLDSLVVYEATGSGRGTRSGRPVLWSSSPAGDGVSMVRVAVPLPGSDDTLFLSGLHAPPPPLAPPPPGAVP